MTAHDVNTIADAVARKYWHAVAFESQLASGPVALSLLGEPIVVARLDDNVLATYDRCPHRSSPLSTGEIRVDPSGTECLVCPYHALHFDVDGRPTHLPARPDERLAERLSLITLPAQVSHGMVWVSLAEQPIGGIPDWSTYDDTANVSFQLGPEPWAAMPTRIVENFNDLGHFATVHANTFGVGEGAEFAVVPTVQIEPHDVDGATIGLDHGVTMHQLDRVTLDGPLVPILADFDYRHVFPFVTELRITYGPDRVEWIQVAFTPTTSLASATPATLVFQQNVRNFDLDGDVPAWHDFQAEVNAEDRRLLESIEPDMIGVDGTDAHEASLGFDDVTVEYRRLWRSAIAAERA